MKILVLIGLCLALNSCNDADDTHHRTYVISKSQLEAEAEADSADLEIEQDYVQD